jgi:hypothetical protein
MTTHISTSQNAKGGQENGSLGTHINTHTQTYPQYCTRESWCKWKPILAQRRAIHKWQGVISPRKGTPSSHCS